MNSALVPPMPDTAGLHRRRCARHSTREAAARCPSCGEFFCRECVVEHDGKLLCAPCLAKLAASGATRRERLRFAGQLARTTLGVIVLWITFYAFGAMLLKFPPSFHEGTVWKDISESASP